MSVEGVDRSHEPITEDEIIWQQWVSDALGTTLTIAPTVSLVPEKGQVSKVLTHIAQQIPGGNVNALARILGLKAQQVRQWAQGKKVPQMDRLLRLCYSLGFPLHEMLFSDPAPIHLQIKGQVVVTPSWRRRPGLPLDREFIRQELEKVLVSDEYPPISLTEVTRRLGYGRLRLHQCHPSACHVIVQRHKDYIQQRKEIRMQGYREEIRQIALRLRREGVTLTRKHIMSQLSQPAMMRNLEVRELVDEVCQEPNNNWAI